MLVTKNPAQPMSPEDALAALRRRIQVDGFEIVLDLDASRGSRLRDARSGRDFLDFYSFFASYPVGYNHPRLHDPDFQARLLTAATTKVANSDIYTTFYAEFVQTLDEVAGLPGFEHFFFIDGGTLAVENALKAAFDWKVRKNLAAGRGEVGHRVLHFRQCFHGRSGYALSLTDSPDPRKTMYFPKFDWPRIDNPVINFALAEPQRTADVAAREAQAVRQIEEAVARCGPEIAALIVEPIQGEGGDNHFRGEFLRKLRELADRHDFLLVFDEIQCGCGITGEMWCCEHFDVLPDILVFGKKMQICGIMAGPRIDEVKENVFRTSSRINSTWGGNITDMVRATEFLRIIRDEELLAHATESGAYLIDQLQGLAGRHTCISGVRGRGLMSAFDLPDPQVRNKLRDACFARGMLILPCGLRSLRFRPVLDVERSELDAGIELLDDALTAIR